MRAAFLLFPLLAAPAFAQGLTPQQVMQLRQVTSVVPSPDGAWLAYAVLSQRGPDEAPGGAKIDAFVESVDGGEAIRVPGATGLAWRPGTTVVTYVGKREDDSAPQVYGIDALGGVEVRLSNTPNGVSGFAWRPDGGAIAYTSLDPLPELRAKNRARGFDQVVVDEDYRQLGLWLWEGDQARRLTADTTVQDIAWSPTGTHLAVALSPRNLVDDHYMFTRLHVVEPATGKVESLVDNPGKLGAFAWSPDGRRLAYISAADRNDPHAGMLYVVERGKAEARALTDGFRGMVDDVAWASDDLLTVLFDVGVDTFISGLPLAGGDLLNGRARKLPAATALARIGDTDRIALVASTPDHPEEVFVEDEAGALKRRTTTNPWLEGVQLGQQRVVRFTATDGVEIEGLAILPVGYDSGKRYPLVIVAHGGPESHYQNGWLTRYSEPGQVLAGMGYVVWYPNYRSSTGYGVAFAKADHGDPMGREFEDHLDAIARFDAEGLIDPARVGVIGGSYGGYTAAWAATRQSEHFAAAVSFVPFTDIRTKWLTTDIPWEFFLVHYQERWPHEQPGLLSDRSPLTWAAQCRTPLLLCGGTADPRVNPSQPFMLYRAVKTATDTPCRYVQYPGEGHGNRINVYRYDYLLRSVQWLDHYLREPGRRMAPPPPMDLEYPRW